VGLSLAVVGTILLLTTILSLWAGPRKKSSW